MSSLDPSLYFPSVTLDDSMICNICKGILDNPFVTPCHHSFCRNCLDLCFQIKYPVIYSLDDIDVLDDKQIDCPYCRQPINYVDVLPNLELFTSIDNIKVFCPDSCGAIIQIKDLDLHKSQCPLHAISCTNVNCSTTIKRQDLSKHLELCPYSVFKCKFQCGLFFYKSDLAHHYAEKECFSSKNRCLNCNLIMLSNSHDCIADLTRTIQLLKAENKILTENLKFFWEESD